MKPHPLLLAAFLALSGCATATAPVTRAPESTTTTASLQGDAARPDAAAGWVRSELYFGVGEESECCFVGWAVAHRPHSLSLGRRRATPRALDV